MLRPSLTTVAIAFLGASAVAQVQVDPAIQPITSPIRHAGVYHLGTGTWTRNASLANLTGPDTIYDNTCDVPYYRGQATGEKVQHRSIVPSPSHPTVPTIVPGGTGNDEAPGCAASYLVNGFQFAYCTSSLATVDWSIGFASSFTDCGLADMVPTNTFVITGLPGGTSVGGQICWIVDIDLDAATLSFSLMGDGDGTYLGPNTVEAFGTDWTLLTASPSTGPFIAGNKTNTMAFPTTPPFTPVPCQGTDGTIWDSPVNLAEPGTGMGSQDNFRLTGTTPAASGPGCYFFNSTVTGLHADFHLELYSAAGCAPSAPGTVFCDPGAAGVLACGCGNPAGGAGMGCNNSAATGGASISGSGTADVTTPNDTLVVSASGIASTGSSCAGFTNTLTCILLQGQGTGTITAGVAFHDGVRCVGGSLKRIQTVTSAGGVATSSVGISATSASLGDTIAPGTTRDYQYWYRDPCATFACPVSGSLNNANISNAYAVLWL